ncbi:nickel pincer cofactor biosynthesis protein LarC [Nocardioides bruguierae]|uniref:nickel pincer cofactor biosynthesis protein LarC n=1 Tax=Nocardioides bruguierae TaxID=2945102 RepID=UPI002021ABCC|nr:nickel pincer cofactor biosynthesis protein LarC [Nocardioides bruguierae]MCL8025268.1 nickel pincer cofactor biosynthesis protein LarC [Nocardioides bruguierae]
MSAAPGRDVPGRDAPGRDVWVDATAGASGDMLLGALVGAGVPLEVIAEAVDAVTPEPVGLSVQRVVRCGLAATKVHVDVADSTHHRTWRDIRTLLTEADLEEPVRRRAVAVFHGLAVAEASVHGTEPDDVHFHEVGALDSIADVVGACAGLAHLLGDDGRLTVSTISVGSGRVRAAHGSLPVPVPAVAELLRGVPSSAGPKGSEGELCTPTGAALLTVLADAHGPQPAMVVAEIGLGAGDRDPSTHPNVVRVLAGEPKVGDGSSSTDVVLEANVDDLDPRVWPSVLAALLEEGASDAWLTPILMKKGRPAHTLSVLCRAELAPELRRTIFVQTSTIGVRQHDVLKHALPREVVTVSVGGKEIRVKAARLDGRVVTVQPEHDDVAGVAETLGRPVLDVLADATAAARRLLLPDPDAVHTYR